MIKPMLVALVAATLASDAQPPAPLLTDLLPPGVPRRLAEQAGLWTAVERCGLRTIAWRRAADRAFVSHVNSLVPDGSPLQQMLYGIAAGAALRGERAATFEGRAFCNRFPPDVLATLDRLAEGGGYRP